jgi:hypothetical protein
VLYSHHQKREEERMKFEAVIHGATFKDQEEEGEETQLQSEEEVFFKDPKVYEKMTPEEKERETEKLMGIMKQMATKPKRPSTFFSGLVGKSDG